MFNLLLIILALLIWLLFQMENLKKEVRQLKKALPDLATAKIPVPQNTGTAGSDGDPTEAPPSPAVSPEAHRLRTRLYDFNLAGNPTREKNK